MRQESLSLTSIRGFAALWVFGHHLDLMLGVMGYPLYGPALKPGYVSVDIFFILSGFILTTVYRGLEWRGVGRFLTRRVFRVYPMHLFVLGAMLVLWLDLYLRHGVHDPTQELRWLPLQALMLQPFFYHQLMWNAVSWSVAVELVCYIVFPLVIMRMRHAPIWLLGLAILILARLEIHLQNYDVVIWGWGAVFRGLVGFGLGLAIRLVSEKITTPSRAIASLIELVALAGIVASVATQHVPYVPLFAAMLIVALSWEAGVIAWVLGFGVCFWLGRISFSVYLLHAEAIGQIWSRFPPTRLPFSHRMDGIVWSLMTVCIVLATATVTWRLVEEPCRRWGGRIGRKVQAATVHAVPASAPAGAD
jgi:peptidoglycan/LPS O-acetylase OafA/YrhL